MNKELFLASEAGDVAAIQRLVDGRNTHDVQSVPIPVDSAPDLAVARGHPNPSNLDVLCDRTFEGDTVLHIAASKAHLDLVKWILQVKPSLADARNKDGNTRLHEAAKCPREHVIEEFLKAKQSSQDRPNKFGDFIKFLESKLSSNFLATAVLIKSLRIEYSPENKVGETPLMIASQYGHVRIVQLLLHALSSQYLPTTPNVEVPRSLREAAYKGYKDVFAVLLEYTHRHRSPRFLSIIMNLFISGENMTLHSAVQGGHLEILKVMLEHRSWRNGSMMKKDEYGRSAIHVAAMKGSWEMVNEFMSRMPDSLQIRSSDDKTVLHFAVEYDQFGVVDRLLAKMEADKAVKMVSRDHDRSRNTAFHFAAKNEANIQILERLLQFRGDNLNALNSEGMTALDIASAAPQPNANCAIIKEKLEGAGGIRSSLTPKSHTTTSDASDDLKKKKDADATNTHMVVASLITTITFAAMFQIPGGIEDDKESMHYGAAKLAFDKVARLFIFSDTVAFTASITVVVGWLIKRQIQERNPRSSVIASLSDFSEASLLLSIFWTVLAFVTATITVTVPHNLHKLKSKDKEAFKKFELLLGYEISLALCTPFLVVFTYLALKKEFRFDYLKDELNGNRARRCYGALLLCCGVTLLLFLRLEEVFSFCCFSSSCISTVCLILLLMMCIQMLYIF